MIISVVLLAGGFAFSSGKAEDGTQDGKIKIRRYSIGTAGTAGSLYPMGVAMAETITNHVEGLAFTGEATAASVENIRNLTSGNLAMGISQSEIAWLAYNAKGDFAKRPAKDLRALFSTIYSYVQVFTLADSSVYAIPDMKGKSIGVSVAGSGGEMCARMILNYFGLTYDDIKPQFIPESEAVTALKDRKIDAFICTHPLKSAALMDLTGSAKVKMLSFEEPAFYKEFPFWTQYKIPSGTYANVNNVVTVPISRVNMFTSLKSGLSEEDVYNIVKAIWENRDEWSKASAAVSRQVVFDAALTEIPIPLHVGAIKYFLEKGVSIPSSLYPPEYKK